ncbi:2-polyprenyl-6-methoxyphenol hydroxylase-like FAD-dependent oxidoreductase [Pedobacter sp. W3I1]|uniref:FAD-dependent oxidoreductase n=1 Tax=Pedobacter sp. W3I1 TaxID=3042291 RepID=UPI00278A60AF|nr:NAD(P)/FAD-dependent oxidoreductase [Pedobacter sp. W3I1]MDQ0638117.1 2-polyprenyl-6-methoxyphenol hydroxylase-like FAD-dependent oxidoreductase [Pedobacter sp. W3I1]
MNNIKDKKIAIIGAGPGGLTLARLLQMDGFNVNVYERDIDENARPKGATLDLHEESGLAALREAKLMDAFLANYRPGADRTRIVDQLGNIVFEDNDTHNREAFRPEIDRGPLQKILLDSLTKDTVIWGSHFEALTPSNGSWLIGFKNGTSAQADIVVAADGANSKIRPYITPIKPFYSGITIVEGAIYSSATACPKMHALLNGGKIFAMGDEKSLIVSSKGDGSLVFYTGCHTAENWAKESGINFSDKNQVIGWFKNEFSNWGPIWLELFENASSAFVPRPQYCMPLDQNWETASNLTMLGDAAHLMPPYAGEGVNMAMLDALELSQCFKDSGFNAPKEAIAAYEKQMLKRASETADITMQSTTALHSADAINYILNIMGPE